MKQSTCNTKTSAEIHNETQIEKPPSIGTFLLTQRRYDSFLILPQQGSNILAFTSGGTLEKSNFICVEVNPVLPDSYGLQIVRSILIKKYMPKSIKQVKAYSVRILLRISRKRYSGSLMIQ